MGRAGSRLSRLARVRHHPRRTAFTGRPAPHPARPTNPTPPTELTTEPPNRHHTNRIRRHRIASQGAGPTSGHIYTGNGTPPGLPLDRCVGVLGHVERALAMLVGELGSRRQRDNAVAREKYEPVAHAEN